MYSQKLIFLILIVSLLQTEGIAGQRKDVYKTSNGKLKIELLGHASILFKYNGISLYCDPVLGEIKNTSLPTADIICITHPHYDHLNLESIKEISGNSTQYLYPQSANKKLQNGFIINEGEQISIHNISIKAVAAYNLDKKYNSDNAYHPKGFGIGYLIQFDELCVYIAGDTDFIPEMHDLPAIDIAFLPIMAPFTMGKEMFAKAIEVIKPKHVYPYHRGNTNMESLEKTINQKINSELEIIL